MLRPCPVVADDSPGLWTHPGYTPIPQEARLRGKWAPLGAPEGFLGRPQASVPTVGGCVDPPWQGHVCPREEGSLLPEDTALNRIPLRCAGPCPDHPAGQPCVGCEAGIQGSICRASAGPARTTAQCVPPRPCAPLHTPRAAGHPAFPPAEAQCVTREPEPPSQTFAVPTVRQGHAGDLGRNHAPWQASGLGAWLLRGSGGQSVQTPPSKEAWAGRPTPQSPPWGLRGHPLAHSPTLCPPGALGPQSRETTASSGSATKTLPGARPT